MLSSETNPFKSIIESIRNVRSNSSSSSLSSSEESKIDETQISDVHVRSSNQRTVTSRVEEAVSVHENRRNSGSFMEGMSSLSSSSSSSSLSSSTPVKNHESVNTNSSRVGDNIQSPEIQPNQNNRMDTTCNNNNDDGEEASHETLPFVSFYKDSSASSIDEDPHASPNRAKADDNKDSESSKNEEIMSTSSLSLQVSQISASVASLFTSKNSITGQSSQSNNLECKVSDDNSSSLLLENTSSSTTTIISALKPDEEEKSNKSCENCCTNQNSKSGDSTTPIHHDYEGMNISRHEYNSFLTVGRQLVQSSAAVPSRSSNESSSISSSSSSIASDSSDRNTSTDGTCSNSRIRQVISNHPKTNLPWYSKLHGDDDLKQYGQTAAEILSVIEPELNMMGTTGSAFVEEKKQTLTARCRYTPSVEPPRLNDEEITKYCINSTVERTKTTFTSDSKLSQILPEEFICPLCKDVLVGSIILDSGCKDSTFCIKCIEQYQKQSSIKNDCPEKKEMDDDDDDGFIMIYHDEAKSNHDEINLYRNESEYSCPQCNKHYNHAIPCHILDVAILNAIRNLDEDSKRRVMKEKKLIRNIKVSYYQRLQCWRDEYLSRQKSELDTRKQLMLSKFLSEQEAIMAELKRRNEREKTASRQKFQQAELPLLAAALIGINVFIFRKWTF